LLSIETPFLQNSIPDKCNTSCARCTIFRAKKPIGPIQFDPRDCFPKIPILHLVKVTLKQSPTYRFPIERPAKRFLQFYEEILVNPLLSGMDIVNDFSIFIRIVCFPFMVFQGSAE
jgi:hypothetical protein